ncbi:MAG: mycothiol transferase [Acidimicrobiia bacterium]
MDVSTLLVEEFGRLPELVREAVADLDADQLATAPAPGANTVAWLVWHLTRVQDHHLSEVMGVDQLYLTEGWHERFGRGPDPEDHGYGHTPADVASVRPGSGDELVAYFDAVHDRTIGFLQGLSQAELDRVVDERWDPPVTLGVRLVSVLADDLQHAGQAAYLRGLLRSG